MKNPLSISIFLLPIMFFVGCLGQECVLATARYQVTFPDNWKVISTGERSVVVGPRGERIFLSSYTISEDNKGDSLQRARQNLVEELRKTMKYTAAHPDLVTLSPFKERVLNSGITLLQVLSKSRDGESFHSQFGVVGPHSSMLISMEGPIEAIASNGLINKCLLDIEWK